MRKIYPYKKCTCSLNWIFVNILTEILLNQSSWLTRVLWLKWILLNQSSWVTRVLWLKCQVVYWIEFLKNRILLYIFLNFFPADFPKPVITSQPMSQKALKGENLTLNCSAVSSGFFDTKFQWKKDSMVRSLPNSLSKCSFYISVKEFTSIINRKKKTSKKKQWNSC